MDTSKWDSIHNPDFDYQGWIGSFTYQAHPLAKRSQVEIKIDAPRISAGGRSKCTSRVKVSITRHYNKKLSEKIRAALKKAQCDNKRCLAAVQAKALKKPTGENLKFAHEAECKSIGGGASNKHYDRFYLGLRMVNGQPNGYATAWNNVRVLSCWRNRALHGPILILQSTSIQDSGRLLEAAYYSNNKLHGRVETKEKGWRLTLIRTFNQGAQVGEQLQFDPRDGRPIRFLSFDDYGKRVGCAGRCAKRYASLQYIGPDTYHRYQNQDFLKHMAAERLMQQAEIAADKRRQLELIERQKRENEARRQRASKAGAGMARQVAKNTIESRRCFDVRVNRATLNPDGWFRVTGEAACKHEEFNVLVAKRFSMLLSPDEAGTWTTYWGVSWTDFD